jgi:DNA-binding response OmpR family regulator/DNA-binding CsgD family transcriptional regulator
MNEVIKSYNHTTTVLIVDDVLDNLAVLHDALDESGFTVLVANNGVKALQIAKDTQPKIILLDAIMPGMDGFQVCVKLKENIDTRHIPVIFMTGLTEAESVAAAFEAGGTDYVTKPIRPKEVLARISSHLQTAKMMTQARGALDAFGQAAIAITPSDGKIVWQTPLARDWMHRYGLLEIDESPAATTTSLFNWIAQVKTAIKAKKQPEQFTVIKNADRLIFNIVDYLSEEHWVILLREESDDAQIEALCAVFKLTKRESEVLYWATKGKTNKDIADILAASPRTINKHLEHVFVKMGVETRTAAASLAATKLRGLK